MDPCPPSMELRKLEPKIRTYGDVNLPRAVSYSQNGELSFLDAFKFRQNKKLKRTSSEAGLSEPPAKRIRELKLKWTGPVDCKDEVNQALDPEIEKKLREMLLKFRKKMADLHQIPSYKVMSSDLIDFIIEKRMTLIENF